MPNGSLFGDGIAAKIKEELLREFNLHTIVRLPNGVFAPYTSIPTNLLFFEAGSTTKEIWYYEQPLPEWWKDRVENERAWKVPAADVIQTNGDGNVLSVNLDIKNPFACSEFLEHDSNPPEVSREQQPSRSFPHPWRGSPLERSRGLWG